ncbi:hypothetical protein ANPL_02555 [Anaplasma platys]|uniref:Uncharacterized protein n=1 Tax=Anaplasma platys TaxID=949 RepID=A0A858PYC5_9RICK|nr:hypothetical protein [Anaplasma platys]QJC27570.1 hypothetical protein ANPL_02555 [Anaplasma platys]
MLCEKRGGGDLLPRYKKLSTVEDADGDTVEATRVVASYTVARDNAVAASSVIFENLLRIRPFLKSKTATRSFSDDTFVGICRIGSELDADEALEKTFHALVDTKVALANVLCNLQCTRDAIERPSCSEYVVLNRSLQNVGLTLGKVEYFCKLLDYEGSLHKVKGNHLLKPVFVTKMLNEFYIMFFTLHRICPEDVVEVDPDGCLQVAEYSLIEAIYAVQEFVYTQNKSTMSDKQLGARSWAASLRRAITLASNTVLMAARKITYTEYELVQLDAALAVRVAGLASEYTPENFVKALTTLVGGLVEKFYAVAYVVRERAQSDDGCKSLAGVSITSACIAKHALGMYYAYVSLGGVSEDRQVSICRSYFEKAVVCEICLYAKAAMCTIENKDDFPILVSRIQRIIDLCALIHDSHVELEKMALCPEECGKKKGPVSDANGLSQSIENRIRRICANVACLTIHHKQNLNSKTFRYIGGVVVCALKALDIFSGRVAINRSYWISDDYDVLRVFPGEVSKGARIICDNFLGKLTPLQFIERVYGNDLHRYMTDASTVDVLPAHRTATPSCQSRSASNLIDHVQVCRKVAISDVSSFQR